MPIPTIPDMSDWTEAERARFAAGVKFRRILDYDGTDTGMIEIIIPPAIQGTGTLRLRRTLFSEELNYMLPEIPKRDDKGKWISPTNSDGPHPTTPPAITIIPEMVNRLARGLYERVCANIQVTPAFFTKVAYEPWEKASKLNREYYIGIATYAIAAMLEPTEGMLAAGAEGIFSYETAGYPNLNGIADGNSDIQEARGIAEKAWRAMAATALRG